VRITVERIVDDATCELFLGVYKKAFAPMATRAVARQALTDAEFREEVRSESVLKVMGWDDEGEPAAMGLVATDLSLVPWISPAFFAARFPEYYERGAVYYFGALLVRPDAQGKGWAEAIVREVLAIMLRNRAICAGDYCRFNVEMAKVPAMVARTTGEIVPMRIDEIDTQHYFAYVPEFEPAEIDLREPAAGVPSTPARVLAPGA
jgi:GNAT superfamily N-acetyltransferase